MSFEIDFLAVGDPGDDGKCSRSGDAIVLRWGNLSGNRDEQAVMVVDGGFTSTGEKLVEHIKSFYKTDWVDYVVSSHPHDDHIQGLIPVLENLKVGTLLIHKPWDHVTAVVDLLNDDRHTYTGSNKRLKDSFKSAKELCDWAVSSGIPVVEPFEGIHSNDGSLLFLGPSLTLYRQLIAADLSGQDVSDTVQPMSLFESTLRALARKITETWDKDKLAEPSVDAVEPLNQTSTVIHLNFGGTTALLTADAGVLALERAATSAEGRGIDLKTCGYIQIPHHGSKRNLGPQILDRIIGPILPFGAQATKYGMLSAATDGAPKHPSLRVTNAALRRGAPVSATRGQTLRWASLDAPKRDGWIPVDSIPFSAAYDEDDD
jgi:beta-lactamase superfamily II metal-dependent hydrolase